ncbi:MAG: glycosyltransferase family 4 protein [Clostridia bacterium]|nr:glycosyltransferase family 4 protein [Clostridia bacterium]
MKILVVCQYYSPEPFRHPDICEELARRGHEVFVVTGTPNYPMGKTYPGYEKGKRQDEIINGVKIHRCYTIPRKNNAFFRILNYYSYVFSSKRYISRIKEKFDVVYVHQLSPVIMAEAAIKYKTKHNVPMILYCLDLWPESMVMGGIKPGNPVYKILHRVSEKIYKSADKVLVSSESFSEYFAREFNITDTCYLPQYAEEVLTPDNCAKTPDGKTDLMFAGNVGTAQDVDTIINAARLLLNVKNLQIHIVGDGSELNRIKDMAADLPNVIFHGRHPIDEMPRYYSMADAMLVTLKSGPLNLTLPGKVQSCLAAGKPIIAAADGETANLIASAKCGFCSPAGNADLLAENIKRFMASDHEELKKRAKDYYCEHFRGSTSAAELEKVFEEQISFKTVKR